jgi:hypothetical protein
MALTQFDLDTAVCAECRRGHTVLYIAQRCHPRAYTMTSYDKRSGHLTVCCAECEKPICEIEVAAGKGHDNEPEAAA